MSFTSTLARLRRSRGWSQEALAHRAGVSQRHLSFLESGRSSPSREMVLRLAERLAVPLRQRNTMLLAAGASQLLGRFKDQAATGPSTY